MSKVKKLISRVIPGMEKPKIPKLPPVASSKTKESKPKEDKLKPGRRASMLTGARGVEDKLGVASRPQAGALTDKLGG